MPFPFPIPDWVDALDARVDAAIEPWRSPSLDRCFYGISAAADHSLLWHTLGWMRAAADDRWTRRALALSAALGAESFITNVVVKSAFKRVRPDDGFDDGPLPMGMRRPITSSFPSGHAAAAMTAAAILSMDDRSRAPIYWSLASLVAGSRVYVRMHHISDVVGGTVWGLVLGRGARRILRRLAR